MVKKEGRQIIIKINLTNRWLYTLITIGILAIVGVGVYAWADPVTGVGHDYTEIQPCANGQILKMSDGAWDCGSDDDAVGITTETDPTITDSRIKDGVSWTEIASRPAD